MPHNFMGHFFSTKAMIKYNFILIIFLISSCSSNRDKANERALDIDSLNLKESVKNDSAVIDIHLKSFMDTLKPVFGYRFKIQGDFNGDGKSDTLIEHYISNFFHKETNKFYLNLDYDNTVMLTMQKDPMCYVSSIKPLIDTLFIRKCGQAFGLEFLKNEGDLDGNGTDEVSYVENYADWSSLNTCHLMTYTKTGWKELYKFSIHDWEIPAMPESSVSFGLFGAQDLYHYSDNDTLNARLEKELKAFSFIKKIKRGVIEVTEMQMDDTDSIPIGDQVKKIVYLNK